jgi:hypothetical protein
MLLFARRILDFAKFGILDLLCRAPQSLAQSDSVSLRLTIGSIAAGLHGHDHAIDTLENVDVDRDNARYVAAQFPG